MDNKSASRLLILASLLWSSDLHAEPLAAQVELALRYEHGEGVARDPARAMTLYCAAAQSGSPEAQYHIGWMYLLGRDVTRDSSLAGRWLIAAAANGDTQAAAVVVRFRLASDGASPQCAALAISVPTRITAAPAEVARLVAEMAPRHGLDPKLVLAVIQVESAFHADAVSPKNAQGLMQVIPATAERFGISNPMDMRDNLTAGMKYLGWLLSYFQGDVTLSLAAYNAGEKRVVDYKGIPPFPETVAYVRRIQTYYPTKHHPFDPRLAARSRARGAVICQPTEQGSCPALVAQGD
jgi:soluble lytic murein transglycosylase-like protein